MKHLALILCAVCLFGCKRQIQPSFSIIEVKSTKTSTNKKITESFSMLNSNSQDFYIGQGYNSATGQLMGRVVQYNPNEELVTVGESRGQLLDFYFDRVQSVEDLKNTLEVNLAASFGVGFASIDARSNFFRQVSFNSYSDYLCAKITIKNPPQQLLNRALTNETRVRMRDGQDEFMKFAGDEYIKGIQTGGQVILIYQFTSSNATERESLQAALNTSIGTFLSSAKTSMSMSKALSSLKTFKNTRVFLYRQGDDMPISEDPDSLINYVNLFPKLMANRGKSAILNFVTEPISNLEGIPYQNRNFDKIFKQKLFVRSGLEQMLTLQSIINNIEYKKINLSSFPKDTQSKLEADKLKTKHFLEQDKFCLENCVHDFNQCSACLLQEDIINTLNNHNTLNSAVVPSIVSIEYKTDNDWLPIIDTKQKFYVVSISGTWYTDPNGNLGGHPLKTYIDQFGNDVWGATLQLRDLNDQVIREWRFNGENIVMDKQDTRLFLRTYVIDPYNNNSRIKVYSSKANPVKITCF